MRPEPSPRVGRSRGGRTAAPIGIVSRRRPGSQPDGSTAVADRSTAARHRAVLPGRAWRRSERRHRSARSRATAVVEPDDAIGARHATPASSPRARADSGKKPVVLMPFLPLQQPCHQAWPELWRGPLRADRVLPAPMRRCARGRPDMFGAWLPWREPLGSRFRRGAQRGGRAGRRDRRGGPDQTHASRGEARAPLLGGDDLFEEAAPSPAAGVAAGDLGGHRPQARHDGPELGQRAAPVEQREAGLAAAGGVGPDAAGVGRIRCGAGRGAVVPRRSGDHEAANEPMGAIDREEVRLAEDRQGDLGRLPQHTLGRASPATAADGPVPVAINPARVFDQSSGVRPSCGLCRSAVVSGSRRVSSTRASTMGPPVGG